MSDFLLELSRNPNARNFIQGLGLPIPLPQPLRRAHGPFEDRPLFDEQIAVSVERAGGPVAAVIAHTLAMAGANPHVAPSSLSAFEGPGEAYGRPPVALDPAVVPPELSLDALVFDASEVGDVGGLRALYDFFHPLVSRLRSSGRAIVIGRPPSGAATVEAAAAQGALEGFVKSLAKEVGRRGSTAQLLYVADGAEARLAHPLRFFLSRHAAFVSGQAVTITSQVKELAGDGAPLVRPLEGKVALVTGAARGIGEAIARRCAGEGAHVVCLDRPGEDALLSRIAREIGGSVLLADISDADSPQAIASRLLEQHGGVDVVVHNAGVTRDKTLVRMSPEAWDGALDINLGAVARITRALLDGAVLRDRGRVVCLSSVAGIAGNMGQTNYAASKAGIIGYIEKLAPSLAGRGITVNAIAPGFIETRLTAAIPVMIREAGRRLSALGQGGLPVDVAEVITFLSTPGASGITGTVLRVCGGALIGK